MGRPCHRMLGPSRHLAGHWCHSGRATDEGVLRYCDRVTASWRWLPVLDWPGTATNLCLLLLPRGTDVAVPYTGAGVAVSNLLIKKKKREEKKSVQEIVQDSSAFSFWGANSDSHHVATGGEGCVNESAAVGLHKWLKLLIP